MKYIIRLILFINLMLFLLMNFSCVKKEIPKNNSNQDTSYVIFLIVGQSNTHQGIGIDTMLDATDNSILQLGRFGFNNKKIIIAKEPLDHHSKLQGEIGFALKFAKEYKKNGLLPIEKIVIIPCGMGSTGLGSNYWNKGDTLYNDAIDRTNYVLKNYKSRLGAILWHQGEDDVGNSNYQSQLDSMIINFRRDLNSPTCPFILGGMVPFWVDQDSARIITNNVISGTVNRVIKTGYADPRKPFVIQKPNNNNVPIHFDATGQRELGLRYFSEYKKLIN